MTREQLEHVIRAAAAITGDGEIVVIGSTSILGQFPNAPAELLVSAEADLYPRHHPERTDLIRYIQQHGADLGLATEVRLNARMGRVEWADFLRRCRGTVGAESGSYYLDRHGGLIQEAKAYCRRHPRATVEEIRARFFQAASLPYVSGKSISSRHFEPIGTKTCQLLLEGHYNGILRPGEHYIPIKKDLSNVQEGVRLFRDETARTRIVERAYQYVMDQHTYPHRVQALVQTVSQSRPMPSVAAGHADT